MICSRGPPPNEVRLSYSRYVCGMKDEVRLGIGSTVQV